MAATATLKYAAKSGEFRSQNNRWEDVWIVKDATSPADAVATAYAAAPSTVTTDDSTTLDIGPARWDEFAENHAGGTTTYYYEVTIAYQPKEQNLTPNNTVRISFDTTGGTAHATQAREQIEVYKVGSDDPPDFKGAINSTKDGVEGCDVIVPVFNFTVTKTFNSGSYPSIGALYALTGKTNDATWTVTDTLTGLSLTFLQGEVLFEGCKGGDSRSDRKIDIVYSFSGSANVTNITIGDITSIDKKGWEYLWVYYVTKKDGVGSNVGAFQVPKFVVVDRVYEEGTFPSL